MLEFIWCFAPYINSSPGGYTVNHHSPEEVSRLLQMAEQVIEDDRSGDVTIVLPEEKQVLISMRDWNYYLCVTEEGSDEEDCLSQLDDGNWGDFEMRFR